MTGQGTETGRNALAGLPAVQSRRLHRNRLYRRGERTFSSLGRRTSATLQDDTAWHYTYNQRSEITSAIRKNASNVTQNNMRYVFDNIGNRTSSYEDATSKTYDANSLNQYTEIDVTGGSSVCPLYDDDGNMTQFDSSTYTYDAENRLVGAQSGTTRLEFIYDALGRRVARKLYLNNTLSKHHRYVYDGMKLLATYNAKSSFAKINSFLWQPFGLDVPLIMTYNSTVYGYLVDANKNVLGLFNPSKTRVATYLYGPFGQKLSESGTIAANNPLQFSSEQFDADLGLVYYNFRYYFPAIGKWLTKDPIGEEGGLNTYAFCGNNAINTWDIFGGQQFNPEIFGFSRNDVLFQSAEQTNCLVTDDAGRKCCPNEMSIIELRIEKTKSCSVSGSGHAFLVQIKNGNVEKAWGFLTKGNIFFSHGVFSGKLEGEHEKDYDFYISYNACEESVKILQKKYEQTKNDKPYYNFLNWRMDYYNCIGMTSYNCIGMASKLLEDANFKAPYISSFPAIPGCNPIHIPLNILLSIVSPTTNILYFVNIIHYGFFNFKYSDKIHSKDER